MSGLVWTVFWLSVLGVMTSYFLYPAAIALLARRPAEVPGNEGGPEPGATIVLAAHDEERVIGRRLRNLAELDYPPERLQILVLSDGSRDRTVQVAREAATPRTRVMAFPERRGKTTVLMESMEAIEGDIVVFTDANSLFEPAALRRLLAPFVDPTVGCVVGELTYINEDNPRIGWGEGLYWRYENALKRWESRLGSTIVANGSIYALRRDLVRPVARHVDFDSMLPLQVLAAGYRVVFEPRARASEKAAETLGEEFRRKVRIIVQQLWGLVAVRGVLTWRRPGPTVMLFCHKILRWLVPFLLGANLLAALAVWPHGLARVAVLAHGLLAGAALAGWLLDRLGLPAGWLWTATYFWAVNLASAAAVLGFLFRRRILRWEKAPSTR